MQPSPDTPALRPSRHGRRRPMRTLERSLRVVGWVALAWVSWGWLDARLYQAQQERLFAETLGATRLQQLAAADPGLNVAGGDAVASAADPKATRGDGDAVSGPRAGTRVEIEGRGPARITEPPAEPEKAARQEKAAAPEATAARSGADRARPADRSAGVPAALPGDAGWGAHSSGLAAVGRLSVPRLGMGVMVAPGVDSRSLRRAAGHIPGTSPPGGDGNVGIAGHRDSFFRPLKRIEIGDEILLTTAEGTARYTVEWTRVVTPAAVEVLAPTPHAALTLVTCYPFHYVGNAPERFIVRARLVEREPALVADADGR